MPKSPNSSPSLLISRPIPRKNGIFSPFFGRSATNSFPRLESALSSRISLPSKGNLPQRPPWFQECPMEPKVIINPFGLREVNSAGTGFRQIPNSQSQGKFAPHQIPSPNSGKMPNQPSAKGPHSPKASQ